MYLLDPTEKMLVLTFLVSSMLSIGMQTAGSDLRSMVASRRFVISTLLVNFLIVPIIGLLIARLMPIEPPVAGALVLLACTPGGLSAVQFTGKVKGQAQMAGAMLCLLSFLALFISPLLLQLALPGDLRLATPYGGALQFFLTFLFLPLFAGMLLLNKAPGVAKKLSRPLALAGVVSFVAFMLVTGSARKVAAGHIGLAATGAMLLFILLTMAVSWFMGGPSRELRQMLATSTSMRNAGLCLAMVHASTAAHDVIVPLTAFSLLMVPPNMLFTLYHAFKAKRKARMVP